MRPIAQNFLKLLKKRALRLSSEPNSKEANRAIKLFLNGSPMKPAQACDFVQRKSVLELAEEDRAPLLRQFAQGIHHFCKLIGGERRSFRIRRPICQFVDQGLIERDKAYSCPQPIATEVESHPA